TDFSATAVEHLAAELARDHDAFASVTLHHRSADDFANLPPRFFDVTLLHSVVQYFPSVDYLERVLTGAVACTADGGVVLVGDVPCLGLLEEFHRAVERFQAPHDSGDEIDRRVRSRVLNEKELWLDPQFFQAFANAGDRVTSVELRPKRGTLRNEFTMFRY